MRDSDSCGRTRPVSATSALSGDGSEAPSVDDWLASPHLSNNVYHLALRHRLPRQEIPDLLQEVRISLIRKGLNSRVNATWVFKTIRSRIVDYYRRLHRSGGNGEREADQEAQIERSDPELVFLLQSRAALLPMHLRAYYVLRYQLGLNQCESARRLGVSRAAVRHLERECLRRLTGSADVAS
jgi:RNA polymerase sigma factor (sigma-70 family)